MMKKIMCLYLLIFSIVYGSFQLAPQVQKINFNRPVTREIHLNNPTDKLVKIKIYSQRPKNQKTKSLYMGDWIIAYPKIIILKPKGKKIVRMAARLPKGLGDGEYRSELVFEEQPIQSYNNKDKDSERLSGGVTVLHTLISTVYGYNGELEYNGNFGEFKLITDEKKTYFVSEITNTGTTALDSFYRITYYDNNMEKLKTEDIALNKIMRENYKNFILELKKISKKSTSMKIEYYCKIESDKQKETEEYKIGEKVIPIEIMSMKEYKKGLNEKNKKVVEKEKIMGKNKGEKSKEQKES